jgi:hypothetical protein
MKSFALHTQEEAQHQTFRQGFKDPMNDNARTLIADHLAHIREIQQNDARCVLQGRTVHVGTGANMKTLRRAQVGHSSATACFTLYEADEMGVHTQVVEVMPDTEVHYEAI